MRDPLKKMRLARNFDLIVRWQSFTPADSISKYVHANRNMWGILGKDTYKRVDYLETAPQSSGMLLLSVSPALAHCKPLVSLGNNAPQHTDGAV